MTESTTLPSRHVYDGIRSLRGWDAVIDSAQAGRADVERTVGRLLSAAILAGGEERMPVAIAGELDANGTGSFALLYPDVVVVATASMIRERGATTDVTVRPLHDITSASVRTEHIHFDGITAYPRHTRLEVGVTVDGIDFTFTRRADHGTVLTSDDAVKAALETLRAGFAR